MRLLREEKSVAILGKDKHGRFGILVPPIVVPTNYGDSSFTADEFAATLFVGDVEQVKQFSAIVPIGQAAALSSCEEHLQGNKRKLSGVSDDENDEYHAHSGAAARAKYYDELLRSLDTRADSKLYHIRSYNNWVKATQIQELNPIVKGRKERAPLPVLDLACGKGGDVGKWARHERGLENYVRVDAARGSLKDAAIRARKMKNFPKCTFTCADLGADVPGRLSSPTRKRMQKLMSWSRQDESEFETGDPEFKMVEGGDIAACCGAQVPKDGESII